MLDRADIERPRHPGELVDWVRATVDRLCSTEASRQAYRRRQGPWTKEFAEEIWPLASCAHLFFESRRDVLFQPILGNQNHDALLLDAASSEVMQPIEITTCQDGIGQQERWRLEHLVQYGRAPQTGVEFERDPATGIVRKVFPEFVDSNEARRNEIGRIEKAIRRKLDPRHNYPNNTMLIVEFQDLHYANPREAQSLRQVAERLFREARHCFAEFVLVGDTRKLGLRVDARGIEVSCESTEC